MTERARKYLADIEIAIDLIESFIEATNSFEAYNSDYKTQSAVERQLGIIGEAVNKYRQENVADILEHAQQIVAFRNRIIHAYDNIDNSVVWVILKKYLPALKSEIENKIKQNK
ncbi:MAG: DUF86 domain-containing protein [Bacteroidales bacterium]|nr:DUF86 domain-containing protein [Bacteroidales bacterium]